MKMIFNQNKNIVPVLCISLIFGILAIYLSVSGYLQVYILHNSGTATATVLGTELSDLRNNRGNSKYVSYTFQVDNKDYVGTETCLKSYATGKHIQIFYRYDNPNKNGLLSVKTGILIFGFFICFFSVSGLRNFLVK